MRLDAPCWQAKGSTAVDVIKDLANEVGIGDVFHDAELAVEERAECDVEFEDPF